MKTIYANGIEIAYRDHGSGPPLLFLHGFPNDHTVWDLQVEALQDRYRLIVPDTRGAGRTKLTDTGSPMTIEQMADDAAALLEALDIPAAAVAGFSMGGFLALHMAVRHPLKVRAVAFIGTRATADTAERAEERVREMRFAIDEGATAFASRFVPRLFAPAFAQAHPEVVEKTRDVFAAQEPMAIAMRIDAMRRREDMAACLHEIACPCLVIGGTQDVLAPPDTAMELHEGLPNSSLVLIEGAGHMTLFEAPDQVSFALDQLLQGAGMWM